MKEEKEEEEKEEEEEEEEEVVDPKETLEEGMFFSAVFACAGCCFWGEM